MADLAQLERALVNADKAGDVDAARALAGEIKRLRGTEETGAVGSVGRQLGLTVRSAAKGVGALPNMAADALAGIAGYPGAFSEAYDRLLDRILPSPSTSTERISGDIASALTGVGGIAKAAQFVSPTSTAGRGIANVLQERIGTQAGAAVAGSGASSGVKEAGGGPIAQLVAGLTAGVAAPVAAQAASQYPRRLLVDSIQKSEARPFAQEGQRLADTTGIELPLGPRTGNKMMLSLENAARRYPLTADRAQDADIKIANQAISRVNQLADAISTRKGDTEHLGQGVQLTVQRAAENISGMREKQAAVDYGAVRKIAGDQPVIRLQGFADELRAMVDEYSAVAGADAQKVVSQASAALQRIAGDGDVVSNTINEALKTRSFYGAAARGGANVFDDISPSLQRRLSARLFGAINKDFETSAANAGGQLKSALDTANKNYAAHSASIEYLQKSALGKLVGEDLVDAALTSRTTNTVPGEAIMRKISTMDPSSRETSVKILEQWNPEITRDLRANVLRSALEEAAAIPPSVKGASEIPISFNRFVRALGGQKTSFVRQLESYGFSKKEIADIRDTAVAMMRAGDTTGLNYSNTATMQESMEIAGALGHSVATGATWGPLAGLRALGTGILSIAGKRVGMNKIVDAMMSEEGRRALRTVASPRASPQAAIAAFSVIGGE